MCEGLVRSGVHSLTLIDFDDICVSNINRQIHAMSSTVGEFKADALKARLLDINPYAKIHVLHEFIRKDNIYDILNSPLSYAASVNSIDNDLAHDSDSNSDDANFIQKREYKYEQCKTFYDLYDTSLNNNNSLVEVPPPATRFDCIIDAADGVSDKAAIVHYCVQTSTMCVLSGGEFRLVILSLKFLLIFLKTIHFYNYLITYMMMLSNDDDCCQVLVGWLILHSFE